MTLPCIKHNNSNRCSRHSAQHRTNITSSTILYQLRETDHQHV